MGQKHTKDITQHPKEVEGPHTAPEMEANDTTVEQRQISCVVIGAGQRGRCYASYATSFPKLLKIVAVADPAENARERFRKKHNIDESMTFKDWDEILSKEKMADFACICTPDRLHKDAAMAFIRKGYHILLEKPMATKEEDCIEICKACNEHGVMLCVCHVLRYFPPNLKIKELIESGVIGDVVNIQHLEPVGFYHFAHSYVRGNWGNTAKSSFSLLAKSCHDIDLICSWMPTKCKRVTSFGSLNHFRAENKPDGASSRCLDCKVESNCLYSALKIYLEPAKYGHFGWPTSVVTDIEDVGVLEEKLRSGPYGRCVYECDNDVCDHQVVNMEFEGGRSVSFTMVAFTQSICHRETKVFGTKGELTCYGGNDVIHFDFLTRQSRTHRCKPLSVAGMGGHGGADYHLMHNLVMAIARNDPSLIKSGIEETLESHRIVFAAENSRLSGTIFEHKENGEWAAV